jgi:alkyl hydroperoxide reductase subunit AhpC
VCQSEFIEFSSERPKYTNTNIRLIEISEEEDFEEIEEKVL